MLMKKCPFCAEEIQDEAVKCKHCGEFLIDAELKEMRKQGDGKWYHRTPTVVISVLLIGPFALPLIWFNPKYSMTSKVIWTIVIIGFTLLLCIGSVGLYANLLRQIEQTGL
jgi:uncharacterized membrane protein YvbJ